MKQKHNSIFLVVATLALSGSSYAAPNAGQRSTPTTPEASGEIRYLPAPAAPKTDSPKVTPPKPAAKKPAAKAPVKKADPVKPASNPSLPVEVKERVELKVADMSTLFLNFQASVIGNEPNSRARLTGAIFKDCADYIKIEQVSSQGHVGYHILDSDGKGMQCMKDHKEKGLRADSSNVVYLSTLPGSTLELGRLPDARVGLMYRDFSQDPSSGAQLRWEDFDSSAAMNHVSRATLDARQRLEERAEKEQVIARARAQIRGCHESLGDIAEARTNGELLSSLGVQSKADQLEMERRLRAQELSILTFRAEHGPTEEFDSLREDLKAYIGRIDKGNCNNAALVYEKMAARLASLKVDRRKGVDITMVTDGYDQGRQIIEESLENNCYSANAQARLENDFRNVRVGRVQAIAQQGLTNNMLFGQSFSELYGEMYNETLNACSGMSGGMEDCASARTALQTTMQIPQKGIQVDQQRYQSQVALQQMMYQMQMQQQQAQLSMSGQQGPMAMNGIPGAVGGYYGSQMPGGMFPGSPSLGGSSPFLRN